MPLVSKVEVRPPDEFDATVNIGVSFIRGEFAVHYRTVEKRPRSYARMNVHGAGMGSAVDVDIEVRISEKEGGGSSTSWAADARVSGRIASLGQRLMEAQAEKIVGQFFECFRAKLG